MTIPLKEKELAAVGNSVAAGCKPCTDHHMKAVRKAGAADQEVAGAVADALAVRRHATDIMEAHALAHLGGPEGGRQAADAADRVKVLVSIGAAFAVNCVTTLEAQLAAAERVGISGEDVAAIVKLAAFIKKMGASHVERLAGAKDEAGERAQAQTQAACCC